MFQHDRNGLPARADSARTGAGLSLPLYVQYTDAWYLAGQALAAQPTASAPRLYVESLNEMIDQQTTRVSALNNRVPSAILWVEVIGAATALGLMALYLAALSPGVVTMLLAAGLLTLLLFVTFDLDRPSRGFITIPTAPLDALRASMELPPAAEAPGLRPAPRRTSRTPAS